MILEPIRIVEVGPRDGLQNEANIVPTPVKVAFVDALSITGLQEIEVSSFVSPKWIPQLADAEQVFQSIKRVEGVTYSALVPNEKGFERAMQAKVDKIAVFTAASESFNRANVNATIDESLERFRSIVSDSPVPVRAYVSTAFYCPFEGKVAPHSVMRVVARLLELGCDEISIGDTIGKAMPEDVIALFAQLSGLCPVQNLAMHFHDTFGMAIQNALTAESLGIRTFDSSAGGIGGCPFAPNAPGNVSTAALVSAFPDRTGVDLKALEQATAIVKPYIRA